MHDGLHGGVAGFYTVGDPAIPCELRGSGGCGGWQNARVNNAVCVAGSDVKVDVVRGDLLVAERCELHGVEEASDAEIACIAVADVEGVGCGFEAEVLAGDGGIDMGGDGAGEEREPGLRYAVPGDEVGEGERGVGREVEGGGVFELDLGAAARTGGERETGLEWDICGGMLPGVAGELFVLLAAGDADVAFDKAEADNLGVGGVGRGWGVGGLRGLCRQVKAEGSEEEWDEATATIKAHRSPPCEPRVLGADVARSEGRRSNRLIGKPQQRHSVDEAVENEDAGIFVVCYESVKGCANGPTQRLANSVTNARTGVPWRSVRF